MLEKPPFLGNRYCNDGKAVIELTDTQKVGIKKFNTKTYPYAQVVDCPVCSHNEFEKVSEKDRYGLPYNLVICRKCGLIFANPYMEESFLERFYCEDTPAIYRGLKDGDMGSMEDYFKRKINNGKKVYDFFRSSVGEIKNKTVVEIGCSSGGILKSFAEAGNKVVGVDYGKQYVQYGCTKGLELYEGDINELIKRKIQADVLIYADTLEHIPNITKQLEIARSLLNDNGLLYVGVPSVRNLSSYQGDFLAQLQNAHVFCFTLTSLTNLMKRSGFELVAGNEQLQAIYKKSVIQKEIVDEYEEIKKYLLQTEKINRSLVKQTKRFVKRALKQLSLTSPFLRG